MPLENQHYVPQTYLERFANSRKQVWVYDKKEKRRFQTHIRNIASEKAFYDSEDVERITGDKAYVEKHLGKLERQYGQHVQSLVDSLESGRFSKLSLRHRTFFSVYLTVQMSRTKESRLETAQIIDSMRAFLEDAAAAGGAEVPEGTPTIDQVDEYARDIHSSHLLDGDFIRECAQILSSHIWMVHRAYGESCFLTGDHPVNKRGHIDHPIRSFSGIASPGIEIVFPLTPRYLLTLCDRGHFSVFVPMDGTFRPLICEDNMIYYNQFPIRYSTRYVFAREPEFEFLEQLIMEEPHWADPDRQRIATNHDDKLQKSR